MRGVFAVGDPNGPRWAVALELLATGKPFELGQVTFRRLDPQTVEAAVASSWQLENVTEQRARSDLDAARARVDALLSEDAEFEDAIDGSTIQYVLVDDYEIGSVAICRLHNGDLVWTDPRPSSRASGVIPERWPMPCSSADTPTGSFAPKLLVA